jgi:class 3 adenylate cyclase/DNA-binding CsgD family transcriptional regulator/tetratricopeptide (TPR) repeat protein
MRDSAGVVAILFTDLVGSTEVLDRLGDDAAEELRRTHFSLLRAAVANADGTEVKSMGDGLMVTFASPVQAVSCAVAMQQAIAEHNRAEPGQMLQVRVGLHVGDPVRAEDDVHGTAVVVAKRLCDRAAGGQILASELVVALVGRRGGFRFRSAGRLTLKGLSEPTPAVAVEWRETARSSEPESRPPSGLRLSGPAATPTPARPLVGRRQELEQIEGALAETASGRGQVAFVVGQMGIGKTRLVEEALGLARSQDFVVLVGRTPAAGSGLAYAPLLSAFGAPLRSLDATNRNELVGDLPHLGRLWPEFGLPPPAPVQDADLERALLFEAVARLLERLSADTPVLLFVDDLHWADSPSLTLLGYLVPTVAASRIALVGTYRPEGMLENKGLRQFVTNARRSGTVTECTLRGLDSDGVAELAAGLLGDAPPQAVLDLSARAAGTPLFVEALIRGLLDAGALVRSDGGWVLTGDRPSTLPRTVHDLIVDRLDLLSADERSTVELIAHGAQGLPHDLLERAGGLDSDGLLSMVRRLVEAGLVVQDDDGPEVVYRLAHPLIQEVAAAELPAVASRRLHARLAHTMEVLRPNDLDGLAYHYWRAGTEVDRDRALDVLLEAGDRARNLAAHNEAARHFGAALPLIRDGQRPELLAQVLERLGASWEPLGETAAAMEVWEEAVSERERAGDMLGVARLRRRLAIAAQATGDMVAIRQHLTAGIKALDGLPPSDELFELHAANLVLDPPPLSDPGRPSAKAVLELAELADRVGTPRAKMQARLAGVLVMYIAGGPAVDRPSVMAQAEEALQIAEGTGEWLLARRARRDLAWLAFFDCDLPRLRFNGEAGLEIDRRLGDIAHEPASLLLLGYAAVIAGDFDEALSIGEDAVARARRYDQNRALAMSLGQLALARTYRGELDAAEEHLAEASHVFPQLHTDPRARYVVGWPQATLALEQGDLAGVQQAALLSSMPLSRILLGTSQVFAGDLDGATETYGLLAAGERPGSCGAAFADRLHGLIGHARGEGDAAREDLERSAAALAALGLRMEAAISLFHAGTVENVRRALGSFEAVGANRYADKARRTLRSLGVRLPSARTGRRADQPLSRREMEVASLVAQGLTNAEIAERLVLSIRTIESHLDHVYARLNISSRAALARWVTAGEAASAP